MHELLLFAQIPPSQHAQLLSILAGIAAMQPQPFLERHLVFKPVRAPGSPAGGQAPGSLGGQGAQTPSIHPHPPTQGMMADGALQAFQAQTKGDTFYVQLVGGLKVGKHVKGEDKKGDRDGDENENGRNGSGEGIADQSGEYQTQQMERTREPDNAKENLEIEPETAYTHAHAHVHEQSSPGKWTLQFRDLPEVPGRRPVVSRLIADYPIQTTDPVAFMAALGFTPTTTFHTSGYRLTHLSTFFTLSHFLLDGSAPHSHSPGGQVRGSSSLRPLDPTLTSLLTLSLRVQDGNKPELLTRGIKELVGIKELLKGVVELGLGGGERLSLDSRVR